MRAILIAVALVALLALGCGGKPAPSLLVTVKTGPNPYYKPGATQKAVKEKAVEDSKGAVEEAKAKEPVKPTPEEKLKARLDRRFPKKPAAEAGMTLKEKFESLKPDHVFEKYDDGVHQGNYKEKVLELNLKVLRVFPAKESHIQLSIPGHPLEKSLILICYFAPEFRDEIKSTVKPGQMVRVRGKHYGWHHSGAYRDKESLTDCGLIQATP